MRNFLLRILPCILPMVIRWAKQCEYEAWDYGRVLNSSEVRIARTVGVYHAHRIGLWLVDSVPPPKNFILRHLAPIAGLPFEHMQALTFRYGIIMRKDQFCHELLAHECRHVHQYEQFGVESFLDKYLRQILTHGYIDAPLEVEAREAAQAYGG